MTDLTHPIHNSKAKVSISPVISKSDIKQLAHIHVEALRDDASATVKFADQEEFRTKIEQMLEGQVRDGDEHRGPETMLESKFAPSRLNDWFIVKATLKTPAKHDPSGKIIGWASWLHENPSPAEESRIHSSTTKQHDESDDRKLLRFNQGLGAFVREHQSDIYRDWCRSRQEENNSSSVGGVLSLRSCFVLPEYQRQGVGTALLCYGCERADALMLDTLVTATEVAKPLYESAGKFEAFGHLKLDLNKFDPISRDDDHISREAPRYYIFWFMARRRQAEIEAHQDLPTKNHVC